MATIKVSSNVPVADTHPAHRHACERCYGLYMRAAKGECSMAEHNMPSADGIVVYGYCDPVCYRGDRPLRSREGQQVADEDES